MTVNALVIGGSGFLGRHLVEELSSTGCSVTVLDPVAPPAVETSGGEPGPVWVEGSVLSAHDVETAFSTAEPDVVYHIAAHSTSGLGLVKSSDIDPGPSIAIAVDGLLNALNTARSGFRGRFVWTSSTTVFGPASAYDGPADEHSLIAPRSVYAASKALCEQIIETYRRTHDVDAVAVRPTLVWGPGLVYRGIQSVLSDMVEAAVSHRAVTVPASDEPWDLIYVKDAARALTVVARSASPPDRVIVNGYVASLDQHRKAVLAQVPDAPIDVAGAGPDLDVPLVDSSTAERMGYHPTFGLDAALEDCFREITRIEGGVRS